MMLTLDLNLAGILDGLANGHILDKNEIKYLLRIRDQEEINLLFKAARTVRTRYFGNQIFFYGFLYFSTFCRNDCRFCQYRKSNKALVRYRQTRMEIQATAGEMAEEGVHLIDLTMGEDPQFYSSDGSGFRQLLEMIKCVQKETRLPVMISPGTLPDSVLVELADAGVTFYACYQETHNETLYKSLRQGQGFEQRLAKKDRAKRLGMLIEEGILTGVGEKVEDLADSIIWMRDAGVDQARVMTFVPQAGTPMAGIEPQDSLMEQIIIAVMRLVLGDVLIPASLDVGGLEGLQVRLDAGANVVTSIVPPQKGLAGVANPSLDIEDSRRTLDHIVPVLKTCGLEPAEMDAYLTWITKRQKASGPTLEIKERQIC